jgi:two-component system, sensor histidine kinase FlrB
LTKSSENTLSLGSKTTNLETPSNKTIDIDALQSAFTLFYEESKKLESQQTELQSQIDLLSTELSESNQRITALIKSMPAGVILLENQIIKIFNPSALHFFPFLKSDQLFAIPKYWKQSITPGEYFIESDESSTLNRTVQVIKINEGFRTIIQIQDITQNILNLQKSQQESRLTAMGKMTASIAHQIRTPLATALIYASHLCDLELDDSTKMDFVQRLRKQLIDLEKLSKEMLQFVSNRPQKLELISVNDFIQDTQLTLQALCDQKKVRLITERCLPTIKISAEKTPLKNALIAILENALEVSSAEQIIKLTTQFDKQRCHIIIEDQGPGIPDHILDTMFEPFFSTGPNGTGLGLSIAKNAIESHRGSIRAENTGHGARFTITLPCIHEFQ